MKRMTSALVAFLLLIGLTACNSAAPQDTDPAPASATQPLPEVSQDEASQPEEEDVQSTQEEPAQPLEALPDYIDEPLTYAADIEEIVSYTITIPQLTLENEDAAAYINDGFCAMADSLIEYAQTTVYETAMQNGTLGFLTGDYSLTQADGRIYVAYTRTVRYASDEQEQRGTRTFCFDLATGERIENP